MSRPSLRRTPKLERLETRQVLSGVVGPYRRQAICPRADQPGPDQPRAAADQADRQHHARRPGDPRPLRPDRRRPQERARARPRPSRRSPGATPSAPSAQAPEPVRGRQRRPDPPGARRGRASTTGSPRPATPTTLTDGENTYAYAESVDEAMQSFLFDWGVADHGHYNNLLQPGTSAQDCLQGRRHRPGEHRRPTASARWS